MIDETLLKQINIFVKYANQILENYWNEFGFIHTRPIHQIDSINDKWAKIVTVQPNATSVFAFICLKDFENKTLGKLKKGDIHKAASWKIPAKHPRGSVYQENFNNCVTPHGIIYLK